MQAAQANVLFQGPLLSISAHANEIQIKKEAMAFLQLLAEPIIVVSIHGAKGSGKTSSIRDILMSSGDGAASMNIPSEQTDSVWLYVKRINYANATYLAFLDGPGFGSDPEHDRLLYYILSGLSSMVIHYVNGELTTESIERFAFLAQHEEEDSQRPKIAFPQAPKLTWLLQNVTTSDLKERLESKNLAMQEVEQAYLRNAYASQDPQSATGVFCEQFLKVFQDQSCFPLPPQDSSAFSKRMEKLVRLLGESGRNRYMKGVILNGPLLGSILISLLAHRDNVFQAFRGRVWKDTIHNCCLNIVESGIKLYKLRMSERLGTIVDTSDLEGFSPDFESSREPLPLLELPCESNVLEEIHTAAKRVAKSNLRTMPVRPGKLNVLLKKLFRDLVNSLYSNIQEENNRVSSELCKSLLSTLHQQMTEKVNKHLQLGAQDDEDGYSFQSSGFKRFFHFYQSYLFELMGEYTDQAKGPKKKQELALFCQNTIRLQIAELNETLEKIRQHDMDVLEESIEQSEKACEAANDMQRRYQKEGMHAQTEVNRRLVEVAKLQALRKEPIEGAIENINSMHEMGQKQKELLEEAAFVSVQLPCEKVIEAAQETEETQLQGYLIKQGGGGNAFNPLGRKNWKQRYFILNGSSLVYAKTKDDYERGRIIKELCLTGCRVEPSKDAGEGFNIIPPAEGNRSHIFELQKGLFEKNSKKKSSIADSGRTFKLRAQSIDERNEWIQKLRQSAGGYK